MRSSELAFAWAKASGILGASCLASRTADLDSLTRLSELDRLLFPASPLNLPEKILPQKLERRIDERTISRICRVLDAFQVPPAILVRLLRTSELSDLKSVIAALDAGERECPEVFDLGRFATVRFSAWPDLSAMLRGTEFDWIEKVPSSPEVPVLEAELDSRYYRRLMDDCELLGRRDRMALLDFLRAEVGMKNLVLALRLRSFYNLSAEAVYPYLIHLDAGARDRDSVKALSLPLDRREAWRHSRWERLLNPADGDRWQMDLRYLQNQGLRQLYRLERRLFRTNPLSVASLAAFIRLLHFEEFILTSVVEALSLGLSSRSILDSLGATR